uniref:Uncharacterized protein n=1 Tax=Utricularia reniformis TaxID=192314 RepID=A0A1Y0B0E1_9LAMI|nr:hypothetical protein AEK19_MT0630 [Utricularia reniformis]ART30885.1 hypothetical protein AEK19_MT0630 [Utricularia reniformis]
MILIVPSSHRSRSRVPDVPEMGREGTNCFDEVARVHYVSLDCPADSKKIC